jgi:hypothetical protein
MLERGRMPEGERRRGLAQVIVGIILFALLTGIWACLWVPPSSIF